MKKLNIKKPNKRVFVISACIVAVLITVSIIASIGSSSGRISQFEFGGEVARGIDVSYHNGEIDWELVSRNTDFAFIRVGYRGYSNGKILFDKKFKANMKSANACDLPVGVYFFSQAISVDEAIEEADFAIKAIKKYDVSLPVVIDFEYGTDKHGNSVGRLKDADLTKKECTDIINAFCERVENAGYVPAVYASTYFFNAVIDTPGIVKSAYIWVADYNEKITYSGKYDIWQYTAKGKIDGVESKTVDINYWYFN